MSTNPIHAALRSSNAASWQIKAEIFDQLLDTYDFAVEVVSHVQIFEHCHTQIQNLMAEEANYKYPFGMLAQCVPFRLQSARRQTWPNDLLVA